MLEYEPSTNSVQSAFEYEPSTTNAQSFDVGDGVGVDVRVLVGVGVDVTVLVDVGVVVGVGVTVLVEVGVGVIEVQSTISSITELVVRCTKVYVPLTRIIKYPPPQRYAGLVSEVLPYTISPTSKFVSFKYTVLELPP